MAFDKTLAAEIIAGMPDEYSELHKCLELEAEAKRALQLTMQAAEQQINAITQARVHLRRCYTGYGLLEKAPAADMSLFGQYEVVA